MEQIVELSKQILKGNIDSVIEAIRENELQSKAVNVLGLCLKDFHSYENNCKKFIDQYSR